MSSWLSEFRRHSWASAETFPGGQRPHFAYNFQVADDAVEMDLHQTLYPFYTTKKVTHVTVTITKNCVSLAATPRTQVCYDSLQYTVGQGLQTFLSEGHISYYSKVRGLDIIVIWNVSLSEWATLYQINMFFVIYIIFSLLTKCLRRPDKMALRTGFGPRAAV